MIPFHIPTPQGCNIQTFYGAGGNANASLRGWNKPPGVSHVYIMLIGGGGDGDGTNGGGSGAVTVWYGAAQHVPDSLILSVSTGNNLNTTVFYRGATPGLINLLEADGANGITAGTSTNESPFAASGFYKSTAGQAGSNGNISASSATFLSGGAGSVSFNMTANYGYTNSVANPSVNGFFIMQPIIVGVGGRDTGRGGIGCGGGRSGTGGTGMALIASW